MVSQQTLGVGYISLAQRAVAFEIISMGPISILKSQNVKGLWEKGDSQSLDFCRLELDS